MFPLCQKALSHTPYIIVIKSPLIGGFRSGQASCQGLACREEAAVGEAGQKGWLSASPDGEKIPLATRPVRTGSTHLPQPTPPKHTTEQQSAASAQRATALFLFTPELQLMPTTLPRDGQSRNYHHLTFTFSHFPENKAEAQKPHLRPPLHGLALHHGLYWGPTGAQNYADALHRWCSFHPHSCP